MTNRTYWFVFCKTELLLQKQDDGSYTIPFSAEPPTSIHEWTNIHNITPMENGDIV